jgi:hypothetical protein
LSFTLSEAKEPATAIFFREQGDEISVSHVQAEQGSFFAGRNQSI